MKVYYYFSVNDLFFAEASKAILQTNNAVEFSGLASGKRSFLTNGPFKSISYLSELNYTTAEIDYLYLASVEKKYSICISDLINMERHFWKFPKKQRIAYAQEIIRCIERDYENIGFDMIFAEGLDDFASFFLYAFGKVLNIPFYYFVYARMGNAVFLTNRTDTGPVNLEILFKKAVAEYSVFINQFEETKKYITEYIANKRQPYYVSQSSMLYRAFSIEDIQTTLKSFAKTFQDNKSFNASGHPLTFPLKRLAKIKNKVQYNSFLKTRFVDYTQLKAQGINYFIYPLHFHPEAATLIQGRWINNQQAIIEMFSKALPANVALIVKEHTVSVGRRPIEFYKEIEKLHNVYFVPEKTAVYELIENSVGIVTISSSMGLEAIMLGKPVVTFGDVHYNVLSDVIKAVDISNMPEYVEMALNFKGYDEAEYWSFFRVVTENCYNMAGYSPHKFTPENVDTFRRMLENIMDDVNI
ncbi:hypothetical protein ACFS5N_08600 [Mucilaginibacter ximonensis]|uniref:Capsule polysaccharide biosynthesis protein n=1 Tax=Mucilaginibacter ximonensis TaxID=538021 RepID=A0ABW5YB41_9SPHI